MCEDQKVFGEGKGLSPNRLLSKSQHLLSDQSAVLLLASLVRGRCSHTVPAVFDAVLSPYPDAGDGEHAGRAGSLFLHLDGRSLCGSSCLAVWWLAPLCFVFPVPILWLSSANGCREWGQEELVTSRWLNVREPREPALSCCSRSGPCFILLMCDLHRLPRRALSYSDTETQGGC